MRRLAGAIDAVLRWLFPLADMKLRDLGDPTPRHDEGEQAYEAARHAAQGRDIRHNSRQHALRHYGALAAHANNEGVRHGHSY